MKQMIFRIPAATVLDELPESVQNAFFSHQCEWPGEIMAGTREHNGEKLILFFTNANIAAIDAIINANSLGWTLIAEEGDDVTGADILDWIEDEAVFDGNGDLTGTQRPVVCPPLLHYFGLPPWSII